METAESTAYARALLTGYYGVRSRDVDAALGRGLPAMELLVTANAAARSGREFSQVLQLRGQGVSWREIERRLGLAAGELCKLRRQEQIGLAARARWRCLWGQEGRRDRACARRDGDRDEEENGRSHATPRHRRDLDRAAGTGDGEPGEPW